MGAVGDFLGDVAEGVGDFVGDVVDAVGDVVEAVGDVVESAVEYVGDVVQAVIDDPLPTILSIAGQAVGIPAPVTMAAVTAARGGDIEDIVLSAGTAYFAPQATSAISSTLSSAIGDAIVNETVSNVVSDGISRGLVSGTIAEVRGGDFEDGFAGGFTGTVVGAGVGEVTNFVKPDVIEFMNDAGIDASTANQIINAGGRAVTAGLTAEITGRGDFDAAFSNSLINTAASGVANFATNSISSQFESIFDSGAGGRSDEQVKSDLANAYANGDISTVNALLSDYRMTADDVQTMFDLTDSDMGQLSGLNFYDQEAVKSDLLDAYSSGNISGVNQLISENHLTADEIQSMFSLSSDDMRSLSQNGLNFYSGDSDTSGGDVSTVTTLTDLESGNSFGTGAGISSTLVDEVDVWIDTGGQDTGTATNVVENSGDEYASNDISGTDSIATISGSETPGTSANTDDTLSDSSNSWLNVDRGEFGEATLSGTEDVSDIAESIDSESEYFDTAPIETVAEEDVGVPGVGGLAAASAATEQPEELGIASRDLLEEVTPDINVYDEYGEKVVDVAGGLNNLVDTRTQTQAPKGLDIKFPTVGSIAAGAKGALNTAIRQGITKSIRGTPTRPMTKTVRTPGPRPVPKVVSPKTTMVKTPAPAKANVQTLRPVTGVTPRRVDVRTLSPVRNIAGLSSLVGKKKMRKNYGNT